MSQLFHPPPVSVFSVTNSNTKGSARITNGSCSNSSTTNEGSFDSNMNGIGCHSGGGSSYLSQFFKELHQWHHSAYLSARSILLDMLQLYSNSSSFTFSCLSPLPCSSLHLQNYFFPSPHPYYYNYHDDQTNLHHQSFASELPGQIAHDDCDDEMQRRNHKEEEERRTPKESEDEEEEGEEEERQQSDWSFSLAFLSH
eukprot:GHVS01050565.1.p1 GENE.GHVS01050565.1~~GHVS01050565.1.p1  ORF type:complete len:211 (-),score=61.29 GHVS01050565.1:216-809(-)